jgi:hypothetical protein
MSYAEALKEQQEITYSAMADAGWKGKDYELARAAYTDTVDALKIVLGPDAHCNEVDIDLYSEFVECFEERVGWKPRGFIDVAGAMDYINQPRKEAELDVQKVLNAELEHKPTAMELAFSAAMNP